MEKYVTVVSVDDQQQQQQQHQLPTDVNGSKEVLNGGVEAIVNAVGHGSDCAVDSQFVTVLSINHGAAPEGSSEPEIVLVYRLPGERLGFGLKFQGGTKNNEKIQRLFIQSCAENSPASRVQASWGFLREGDEILEIDGVTVTQMTRIECVKCLKESNLAIKLLVRNGEGKVQNFFDENGDVPEKKSVPPPPPPVPPRKLNKRKVVEQHAVEPPAKQIVEIVHPPDAEVYSNLFSDDISDLISESDDTASTISTVIDKYSICSSLSSEDYTISSNPSSLELAKALKPFTLLEKEFNLEDKLESNLFTFQPSAVNIVQVEIEAPSNSNEYENVSIAKVDENKNYENVIVQASDHHPQNYENVTIQEVLDTRPYENVVITTTGDKTDSTVYENVDLKAPPRPAPRQGGAVIEPKKRAAPLPAEIIPPPRQKSPKFPPQLPHEFNTIQSWLQEATEVIHECALAPHVESPKDDKRTGSNESLPRLIDFHPKVSSPFKPVSSSPQPTTIVSVNDVARNDNDNNDDDDADFEPERSPTTTTVVVKKCIKISADSVAQGQAENYIDSSSSSDDEERSYEPHAFRQQHYREADDDDDDDEEEDELERRSCDESGAFDTYSDEDGEKLGPPEIVAGGPSEAYFNFHWSTTLLPPIGEVEEEFSSLENQQSGPIVIIDTAEETLFNDNNNNQHREPKPKLNGHHEYIPEVEDDEPFSLELSVESQRQEVIPTTSIFVQNNPSRQSATSSTLITNDTELDTNSAHSDAISAPVENKTAVDGNESQLAADKSQVQVDVDNDDDRKVEQPTADNELIVLERNSSAVEGAVDQLTNDIVDNGVTVLESIAPEKSAVTVNMEVGPDVPELARDDTTGGQKDVTDDDVDLLAVVGDSVESDFEELVKAQIEQNDDDNSEQIQQIHERIIVGIERSSTSGDEGDVELGGVVEKHVISAEEGEKSDASENSVETQEDHPEDIPDGVSEPAKTPDVDEQNTDNNQGK
ncbi:uncharacterized protein LOC134225387 isoform X2 [Armigeres subalbatus]|uniref:uncharacterized protein LOC134225387 isoform X2 n=1 Tax=Armigeres subalbatus TaxID=124917 RepID=UPI002ED08CCD